MPYIIGYISGETTVCSALVSENPQPDPREMCALVSLVGGVLAPTHPRKTTPTSYFARDAEMPPHPSPYHDNEELELALKGLLRRE